VEPFLAFVHVTSLAIWVGGLALLYLIVSPNIYRLLSDELAETLEFHIHASFSMLAPACGVGALVSLVALALAGAHVGWFWSRVALLVAMTLIALNASWFLQPRALSVATPLDPFKQHPDREKAEEDADRRQRYSWQLNGVVLLLGLIALWLSAGGPAI